MRVLVTGASGFLGTSLCPYLEQQGHAVTRLTSRHCDLTREGGLERFNETKYDQIYHLAAWTQAGEFCLQHPGEQWIINQQINTTVLAWWQRHQPQAKMICIGSSCAYAPGADLRESNYMLDVPIDSLYAYAMTKRMLYAGALALHRQYGVRYLCAVPSTLYGPGYHTDGRQMHFIFDLIQKIIRGKEFDDPVRLWGDGYQKREVMFLPDFVRLLYQLTAARDNDLVNLGTGEEHTIRRFAELICDIVGYRAEAIAYDTSRYVGAASKCLNVEKLRSILPPYQLTPLKSGLEETIRWFYEARAYA